jgi:hypothetical protein
VVHDGALGSAGFDRSVSVGPPPSPGISLALYSVTISAPPPGIPGCSSAGVPAGAESAARILSADNGVFAAGVPIASADLLDFGFEV